MLTKFNGTTITYDTIGNPISYENGKSGYYLSWDNGRTLRQATVDNAESYYIGYDYDLDGIRTKKTVTADSTGTTTTHEYITQNGKIVRETMTSGTATRVFDFIYDENGRPFACKYTINGTTTTTMYYALNLQGDVVRILNANGSTMVKYAYNAWGELLSVTNGNDVPITSATHIGNLNPLRYRGYYYDSETNFYYLQSRYYDPVIRRFINADSYASTGQSIIGTNMFSYCNNDPLSFSDPSGEKIVVAEGATEEELEQYCRAVAYINSSEAGRALIAKLESSDVVFTIVFVNDNMTRFTPGERTIYFDLDCGAKLNDGVSVQSPALALAHEMGHAAQYLDGQLDLFILLDSMLKGYLVEEIEMENLKLYETPIAKQLGEPIRNNYNDAIAGMAMNNSTHYITKGTRHWTYFILPWHWLDSKTYPIHHNE